MATISWKTGINGTWATAADWSNGLVPGAADDVTIGVAGTYAVSVNAAAAAHSLALNAAGAAVNINNVLTVGTTLTLSAGALRLNSGGTIAGGVINRTGGAFVANGGTLNGVTFQGTLDIGATSAALTISNSFAMSGANGIGAGTINLTGQNSSLNFSDATTFGNVTINATGYGSNLSFSAATTSSANTFRARTSRPIRSCSASPSRWRPAAARRRSWRC